MKKVFTIAFCLFAVMLTFNANAKIDRSEILGLWMQTVNEQGVTAISTYDFKENGRIDQTLVMTAANPEMTIEAVAECDYTFKDDKIIFTFSGKDVDITKFEMEGVPDSLVQPLIEQTKQGMVNQKQEIKIIKIEGNTMEAKLNGEKITLVRQ